MSTGNRPKRPKKRIKKNRSKSSASRIVQSLPPPHGIQSEVKLATPTNHFTLPKDGYDAEFVPVEIQDGGQKGENKPKKTKTWKERAKYWSFFFLWVFIIIEVFFLSIPHYALSLFSASIADTYAPIGYLVPFLLTVFTLHFMNIGFSGLLWRFFIFPFSIFGSMLVTTGKAFWLFFKMLRAIIAVSRKLRSVVVHYSLIISGACISLSYSHIPHMAILAILLLSLGLTLHILRRFLTLNSWDKIFDYIQRKNSAYDLGKSLEFAVKNADSSHKDQSEPKDAIAHLFDQIMPIWVQFRIFDILSIMRQGSPLIVWSFLFKVIRTFAVSVVVFACLYYSVQHLHPRAINNLDAQSFWSYLYFSFITMLMMEDVSYAPMDRYGKIVYASELLCSLAIGMILFFIFTTIILGRYESNLQRLQQKMSTFSMRVGCFLERRFDMSIDEVHSTIKSKWEETGLKWLDEFIAPSKDNWIETKHRFRERRDKASDTISQETFGYMSQTDLAPAESSHNQAPAGEG